jgi:adenylate cyclase class 2
MKSGEIEIEVKFYLPHLEDIRKRVLDRGGHLLVQRLLERNLRFDTHDNRLRANHEVLRLRQGERTTLTYKRSHSAEERTEAELEVDDFNTARSILQALGYTVIFIYEKYRETFALDQTKVMLDELPFGYFVEIEGPSLLEIKQAAISLGLEWEDRIKSSYLDLFFILQQHFNLPFTDVTFDNFASCSTIEPTDLGLDDFRLNQ